MNGKNKKIILLLYMLLVFPISSISKVEEFESKRSFGLLKSSQGTQNYTLTTFLPKIIWLEGQLRLSITSNQTGQVNCYFGDTSNNFNPFNDSLSVIGNNETQIFIIKTNSRIETIPGIYLFKLNLSGFIIYYEEFEVLFGLGLLPMFLLISVSLGLIIYIIFKKDKEEEEKTNISFESSGESQKGKIDCPNCHKQILEGLTFCPECGERIPEFLRYGPTSG